MNVGVGSLADPKDHRGVSPLSAPLTMPEGVLPVDQVY